MPFSHQDGGGHLSVNNKKLDKQYITPCIEGHVCKEKLKSVKATKRHQKFKVTFVAVRCAEFPADSGLSRKKWSHYVNNNLTL